MHFTLTNYNKDEIKILTQDKQELEKALSKNEGHQISAIELPKQAKTYNSSKVKTNAMQKPNKLEMQM